MRQPKISGIMPHLYRVTYLSQAIESIWGQMFLDFGYILINERSIDHSVDIIQTYNDHA